MTFVLAFLKPLDRIQTHLGDLVSQAGPAGAHLFAPTPLEALEGLKIIICDMRWCGIDCVMLVAFRFGRKACTCMIGENV